MKRLAALLSAAAVIAAPCGVAAGPEKLAYDLREAVTSSAGSQETVWVFFTDKGSDSSTFTMRASLAPRALSRRALRGHATPTMEDAPLARGHVDAVRAGVRRLRHESRWFNAVSVEATSTQVLALAELPFVARLERVRGLGRRPDPLVEEGRAAATSTGTSATAHAFDYGTSLGQLAQIHVPEVHDLGLHGENVVVAVFDAGFDTLGHESLAPVRILATRDFVNGDDDVGNGGIGEGSHGTATLSTIAGFRPGQLIGPAFAATYLLAKTENTETETPREEDNWAAAVEWAESLGVDVISTSLGYNAFDAPFPGYAPSQLDGATAISTRAAELAVARGVVVVASAGNAGFHPDHNTLGAPADGPGVITAGGVDPTGRRASFSSVGPSADGRIKPDVAAQAVAVKVARTGTLNVYAAANGTSFSCPLTAGVAALVLQAHPEYTPAQVATVMRATASQSATPDTLLGFGIVNALAAVQAPAPPR